MSNVDVISTGANFEHIRIRSRGSKFVSVKDLINKLKTDKQLNDNQAVKKYLGFLIDHMIEIL